jgi:4-carboxymuconolactone decarboxylase
MPLTALDPPTTALVLLAAAIAGGSESDVRDALTAAEEVPHAWIDELIVQSYLFSGFPRALNAAREWRRISPDVAPQPDDDATADDSRRRGEITCAAVYGDVYDKLRANVRALHPALDSAMLVEGYGRILSRPALDLPRRELCIVAACAVTGQDRQLHSHLHGALNVGVTPEALTAAIEALAPVLGPDRTRSVQLLLARVVGK